MNALYREGTITNWPILSVRHGITPFVERPDSRYAQAYCRHAWRELFQCEQQGRLTAREHTALQAGMQYRGDQIEALQRLADVQSYAAVNP